MSNGALSVALKSSVAAYGALNVAGVFSVAQMERLVSPSFSVAVDGALSVAEVQCRRRWSA